MTTTPTTHTARTLTPPTRSATADLAGREVTESDTRATRLAVLEAQVSQARDDLVDAAACADPSHAITAMAELATLLQHTLQELALLARETSPR